jgi:hypothetical protein
VKERIVTRIINGIVLLALVAAAVYLVAIDRAEHVDKLFALGLTALGVAGVVLRSPFGGSDEKAARKPPTAPLSALLVLVLLVGCGGGELAAQARAATVTAGVLTAGGAAADAAHAQALDDVERRYPADPEHDAQLELEAARWAPLGASLDAARTALLTWIDGIELARLAGEGSDLLGALATVAARAVQLVARALSAASSLGAEGVPTIPPAVMTLARGLAGGE